MSAFTWICALLGGKWKEEEEKKTNNIFLWSFPIDSYLFLHHLSQIYFFSVSSFLIFTTAKQKCNIMEKSLSPGLSSGQCNNALLFSTKIRPNPFSAGKRFSLILILEFTIELQTTYTWIDKKHEFHIHSGSWNTTVMNSQQTIYEHRCSLEANQWTVWLKNPSPLISSQDAL